MIDAATLDRLPTDPGVYLFKDKHQKIVYVGKAKNLRTRVKQYFRPGGDERYFVAAGYLGRAVVEIETIVVSAEKEALLLENHLIKKHQPKFNVKLRDDKQYLVLRVSPPRPNAAHLPLQFPRVEVVRNIADDDAAYFGPYHSATGARQTLRILNRHFQLRTCTDHVLAHRGKTCLQYQIKRCLGPCALPVSPAGYAEKVEDVVLFLAGKDKDLTARLRARMLAAAESEDYETAATLRDSMAAVERTLARQDMVQDDFVDQDVWGLFRQADAVEVVVLFIRAGKLVGRRAFAQREQELPDADVIGEHVQQYYATGTFIPDEVMVGVTLENAGALAEWLSAARGRKVRVVEPQRGQRARLVELADKNAAASAASRRGRDADAEALLLKLQTRLGLERLPRRIECFDIAHIQGRQTVASMVTFVDGVPAKSLYRKFRVRTVTNDDFASMFEVLSRRFRRAQQAEGAEPDAMEEAAAAAEPDTGSAATVDTMELAVAAAAVDTTELAVAAAAVASAHAGDAAMGAVDACDPDLAALMRADADDEFAVLDANHAEGADDRDGDQPDDLAPAGPIAAVAGPARDTREATGAEFDPARRGGWALPDLIVIDGGKGQLGMALAALADIGVPLGRTGVEIISLAKERELAAGQAPDRVYVRNVKDAIALGANSPELYLLARLRDEAHRFANTFHRQARSKATLHSELDEIPGIGATRRKALLAHFGSVRAIREATEAQLAAAPKMTKAAARTVYEALQQGAVPVVAAGLAATVGPSAAVASAGATAVSSGASASSAETAPAAKTAKPRS